MGAKEDIKAALKTLNDHLLTKTFLVGERLTLADIAVACTMLSLYKQVLDPAFRKPFTNVNRWFTTVVNQPNAKVVLAKLTSAQKWLSLTPRSLQSFQERVTIRRKRKRSQSRNPRSSQRKRRKRRNQSLRRMFQKLRRILTPLRRCPRVLLTWKSGRGFTPTMMTRVSQVVLG